MAAENLLRFQLPHPWTFSVSHNGRVFFINEESRSTTWLHPENNHPVQSGHMSYSDLPQGWEMSYSAEGAPYYIDHNNLRTTFQHPITGENAAVKVAPDRHSQVPDSPRSLSSRGDSKKQGIKKRNKSKVVYQIPSARRSQQAPISIQGWLYKQDSTPLKNWRRRWFILSDFVLFIYKSPDEQQANGSILLPSYKINPCTLNDGISRKFAFKASHENMRTYYFASDTKDNMSRWMNAMSLATILQQDPSLEKESNNNTLGYDDGSFQKQGRNPSSPTSPQTPGIHLDDQSVYIPRNLSDEGYCTQPGVSPLLPESSPNSLLQQDSMNECSQPLENFDHNNYANHNGYHPSSDPIEYVGWPTSFSTSEQGYNTYGVTKPGVHYNEQTQLNYSPGDFMNTSQQLSSMSDSNQNPPHSASQERLASHLLKVNNLPQPQGSPGQWSNQQPEPMIPISRSPSFIKVPSQSSSNRNSLLLHAEFPTTHSHRRSKMSGGTDEYPEFRTPNQSSNNVTLGYNHDQPIYENLASPVLDSCNPHRPPLPAEYHQDSIRDISETKTTQSHRDLLQAAYMEQKRLNDPLYFQYPEHPEQEATTMSNDMPRRLVEQEKHQSEDDEYVTYANRGLDYGYPKSSQEISEKGIVDDPFKSFTKSSIPSENHDSTYSVIPGDLSEAPIVPGQARTQLHPEFGTLARNIHTIKEDPAMSDADILATKKLLILQNHLNGHRLRLSISAADLVGKSHEELVLLLIQLRRSQSRLEDMKNWYRSQMGIGRESEKQYKKQRQLSSGNLGHGAEEEHWHYQTLKRHNNELEKQLEVHKPLVNLVDNLVTMGSLYGGKDHLLIAEYKKQQLTQSQPNPSKKMIEFSRQHQEERHLQEQDEVLRELTEDEADLEEKLQQLYVLDRELQEQSFSVTSLQEDKELLDKALTGIKEQEDNENNHHMVGKLKQQQQTIEQELSKVRLQLADAFKTLEEKSAENARVENEVILLRKKIAKSLDRSSSTHSLSSGSARTRMKLESEVMNIQNLMDELSSQGEKLSKAMMSLRTNEKMEAKKDGNRCVFGSYAETNLDTMNTVNFADNALMGFNKESSYQISSPAISRHFSQNGHPAYNPQKNNPVYEYDPNSGLGSDNGTFNTSAHYTTYKSERTERLLPRERHASAPYQSAGNNPSNAPHNTTGAYLPGFSLSQPQLHPMPKFNHSRENSFDSLAPAKPPRLHQSNESLSSISKYQEGSDSFMYGHGRQYGSERHINCNENQPTQIGGSTPHIAVTNPSIHHEHEGYDGYFNENLEYSKSTPSLHYDNQSSSCQQNSSFVDDNIKRYYDLMPRERPRSVRDVKKRESVRKEKRRNSSDDLGIDDYQETNESAIKIESAQNESLPDGWELKLSHSIPPNATQNSSIPPSSEDSHGKRRSASDRLFPNNSVNGSIQSLNSNSSERHQPHRHDNLPVPRVFMPSKSRPSTRFASGIKPDPLANEMPSWLKESQSQTRDRPLKMIDRRDVRRQTVSSSQPIKMEKDASFPMKRKSRVHTAAGELIISKMTSQLPDIVRAGSDKENYFDENTIDKELFMPDKVEIPERYISDSDEDDIPFEEIVKRDELATKYKKMLAHQSLQEWSETELESGRGAVHLKLHDEKQRRETILDIRGALAKEVTQVSREVAERSYQQRHIVAMKKRIEHRMASVGDAIREHRKASSSGQTSP